jgi:hypothetical protein
LEGLEGFLEEVDHLVDEVISDEIQVEGSISEEEVREVVAQGIRRG